MSRLIGLGLLLAGLLYPFAVYFGMEHFAPWQFGLLLGSLWLARALTGERRPGSLLMAGVALVFCVLLALFDSPSLLRWYPVLVSGFMLTLFGLSLKFGPPVAERLARLSEPELPEKAIRYTRQVTVAWSVFFLCNGLLAAALTLWAPLSWWTLYNGLIAYGLMGLLFAIEWLLRQRVRGRA
ncbi:membrane protein [Pseudomonas chlororaphis subsp. aurantiaca]|uniref:COG4648 family protein n=1 Tax=Pseudomonas chlororaphis TaxID=587753 RepID=UPI00050D129E|nr:membrane protein [Pseudomonas chlororaphis]AIS15373.1 membrane protein [Pseudomonas chlororaphis subsp. aurantiaca]